jgi:superfamily I DNA/RNA helicase
VKYDALVVDEAQDFSVEWWYALTQSLLTTPDAPIYAFMDPNQSLRGEVQAPPIEFSTRFRLTINCRNTRRIATASALVLGIETHPFLRAPSGLQPRIVLAATDRQQRALVVDEVRRLLEREEVKPHQIVLLGPAAKANGSLSDLDKIGNIPLVTSAESWRDGDGILVSTARAFKGLEADVVILYDLSDFGKLFQKSDLYVACTRARALLVAVVHGDQCRSVIESAVAASVS